MGKSWYENKETIDHKLPFWIKKAKHNNNNNIVQIINQTLRAISGDYFIRERAELKIDVTTQWDPNANDKTIDQSLEGKRFPHRGMICTGLQV